MKAEDCKHRMDLPRLFTARGYRKGAEIGVQRGNFASHILRNWQGTLFLVDPWRHLDGYNDAANVSDEEQEKIMHQAIFACANAGDGRFSTMRTLSLDAAKTFASAGMKLDFVYLDADHSYASVKADIEAWLPLVRDGGILCGHDWIADGEYKFGSFGVQRAVKEAFPEKTIHVTAEKDGSAPSWIVEV